jgi:hypothetical protein
MVARAHRGGARVIAEERLRRCDGWVASLRGHTVAFTGQVLVDGTWVPQARCAELAAHKGAAWRDDWASTVTLLVHGDLAGKQVIDPQRGYSRKLVAAQQARRQGTHVHVVDADGFSDLLAGAVARCRRVRRRAGQVVVEARPAVDPLPSDQHAVPAQQRLGRNEKRCPPLSGSTRLAAASRTRSAAVNLGRPVVRRSTRS